MSGTMFSASSVLAGTKELGAELTSIISGRDIMNDGCPVGLVTVFLHAAVKTEGFSAGGGHGVHSVTTNRTHHRGVGQFPVVVRQLVVKSQQEATVPNDPAPAPHVQQKAQHTTAFSARMSASYSWLRSLRCFLQNLALPSSLASFLVWAEATVRRLAK